MAQPILLGMVYGSIRTTYTILTLQLLVSSSNVYTCVVYVMYECLLHTVDRISLSGSEFTVEEGSKEVLINITRTGKLVDDIIVKFVAREISSAINPAIRKIFASERSGVECAHVYFRLTN